MPDKKPKHSHGLTVLYRTANEWNVFDEAMTPQELAEVVARCKRRTASRWIWWGPSAIAEWLVANPRAGEREEAIPNEVLAQGLEQLAAEQALLSQGLEVISGLVKSFKDLVAENQREKRRD